MTPELLGIGFAGAWTFKLPDLSIGANGNVPDVLVAWLLELGAASLLAFQIFSRRFRRLFA